MKALIKTPLVAALFAALAIPHAAMATGIWSGTSNNTWATAGNWDAIPTSGSGLTFTSATGAGGLNLNNNLTTGTGWTVSGITFSSGAAAFVIGDGTTATDSNAGKGNAFTLNNAITNNSTSIETINSAIAIGTTVSVTGNNTSSGAVVLGGPISGIGGINISNNTTLTLSGNNSFSGGITVGGNSALPSTLNINNAGALGSGNFSITNGAIINNTSGSAVTLSSNNAVTFGSAFSYGGSQDLTFGSGAITASGFIASLNGTGRTLTFGGVLSNTNTTGTVGGRGNTLVLGGLGLLSNASNGTFSINGDSNVTITGGVTNGGSQTNNGLTWSNMGTLELRGANTFNGTLTINSGGTVKITSTSTFGTANALILNSGGGALVYDNTGASGASSLTLGAIVLGSGSTGGSFNIQTNHIANQNITLTVGAITRSGQNTSMNFVTNGGTNDGTSNSIFITNAAGPLALGGVAGDAYYNGADFAAVNSTNGYVRAINYGTDSNTQTTLTGATASTWVKLSSTVTPSGNVSLKALTLSGAVDFTQSSGNLTTTAILKSGGGNSTISGSTALVTGGTQSYIRVDTASDKLTISSPITGTASLTKTGLGTLVLTGNNTFTNAGRGFSINEGALSAVDGVGLPTGELLTLLGGVFESSGNFTRTVGSSGGNVQWLASGGFSAQGGTLNIRLGNGTATQTWGSGSFVANYRELVFGSVTADSLVDFQNALSISTNSNVIRVLDNTGSTGDKARISGNITGSGRLIKEGAGTLELTGTNTYTGTTTVNAGTLLLASNGAGNSTSSISVNNAGTTLAVNYGGGSDYTQVQVGTLLAKTTFGATTTALAFDTTNGNGTYSNALTMAAGLTKLGANTLTLNGTNTYTGVTTVSAGTLLVNGSTSASSAVNVSSGATLGGSGTVAGVVSINNGGTISPGNSPGTLTVGSLLLNSTSSTVFEVNGVAVAGSDYDKIVVNTSGGLTLNGTFTIAFGNISELPNSTDINLFQYTGSHTGDFSLLTSSGFYASSGWAWNPLDETFSMSYNGQTLTFSELTGNLNVVPEPATWMLLALSLTTVVVLRRRPRVVAALKP